MERGREKGMDLHTYEWREQTVKQPQRGGEELPGLA